MTTLKCETCNFPLIKTPEYHRGVHYKREKNKLFPIIFVSLECPQCHTINSFDLDTYLFSEESWMKNLD